MTDTTPHSDSELYQQVTDICAENGGVTKSMVDKLVALFDRRAEKLVVEARIDELERFYNQERYPIATKVIFNEYYEERIAALTATKEED
jgi:hypothetical protein